jgi:hypothetical protein
MYTEEYIIVFFKHAGEIDIGSDMTLRVILDKYAQHIKRIFSDERKIAAPGCASR